MARKTRNQKIAVLINTIEVSAKMQAQARATGDDEGVRLWFDSNATATVELADRYGIELPALDIYRTHLRSIQVRQLRAA